MTSSERAPKCLVFEEGRELTARPSWAWRPSWYSGSDSIYAVLAKFAALNRIKARDLCELFIEPNPDSRRYRMVGRPIYPKIDLRYPQHVRYGRLANILQLDAEQLRQGFVSEQFPNAAALSSPYLVWCPQCADRGFHSVSFQLNFFQQCPLHRRPLRRKCYVCDRPLPYWLYPPRSVGFFVCPHCGHDHASKLNRVRVDLALEDEQAAMFIDHVELIRFVDSLPTLVNAQRAAMGAPNLPVLISKADAFRTRAHFHQFVTDMLASLAARRGPPQAQLACEPPSALYTEPYLPARKIARTPPSIRDPDEVLHDAQVTYRSVRRWLRRHVIGEHRGCLATAQKRIWWDTEGETTCTFCPVALAFLRWRMQWEGCRVPSSLDRRNPSRVPLGLLGWVSADAPIPSPLWTPGFGRWLMHHLLGFACLDSFYGWFAASDRAAHEGQVTWNLAERERFSFRHWACSGRGTPHEPGLLYVETTWDDRDLRAQTACNRSHRRQHDEALAKISR